MSSLLVVPTNNTMNIFETINVIYSPVDVNWLAAFSTRVQYPVTLTLFRASPATDMTYTVFYSLFFIDKKITEVPDTVAAPRGDGSTL